MRATIRLVYAVAGVAIGWLAGGERVAAAGVPSGRASDLRIADPVRIGV
jgi:hypothetical protein